MKKITSTWLPVSLVLIINIVLDRLTKMAAQEYLKGEGHHYFLNKLVLIVYAENDGAFLSLFSNLIEPLKTILLIAFPVVILIGTLYYLYFDGSFSRWERFCIASIIGGGASNVFDRIVFGSVIDFMNFGIGNLRTGILNVADLSVTFGAVFLIIGMSLHSRKAKQEESLKKEENQDQS